MGPHGHCGCRSRPSIDSGHVVVVKQAVTAADAVPKLHATRTTRSLTTCGRGTIQLTSKRVSLQAGGSASRKALAFGPSTTAARATKASAPCWGIDQCRPLNRPLRPLCLLSAPPRVPGCSCSRRETDRDEIQPSQTNSIPGHQVWCPNMINSNTDSDPEWPLHRPLHRPLPTVTPATKPV